MTAAVGCVDRLLADGHVPYHEPVTQRQALLIGVPQCDDATFSPISQVVRNDLEKMRSALTLSSYSVDSIGEDTLDPSGNRIRAAIRKACAGAPEGSVLLLYFSGHGVSIDGVDYLVPSDAFREGGELILDSLVPVIPDLSHCQAKLVVFFVDACRDSPAGLPSEGGGGGVLHYPAGGSQVMVAGCAPGQVCHYGEDGSVFTRTLARVLDRRHPARTLSAVLNEVTKEMRRTTGRGDDRSQVPNAYPVMMLRNAADQVICEGDELVSAWRRVAAENRLWDLTSGITDEIRGHVTGIAEDCARTYLEVSDLLREKTGMTDHWFDPNYPARTIDFTAEILTEGTPILPEEAAVMIAAPFMREAVLAEGVRKAAAIRPGDFKRCYERGHRTDLELTHEMYPQVTRRVEGLTRRHETEAAETLVMWLVHRWVDGFTGLWKLPRSQACADRGAYLIRRTVADLSQGECRHLVETLIRAVAAGPADARLEGRLAALPDDWRGKTGVLWLAGTLAADPRRLPAVIADHIGTGLELSLASVKDAADLLRAQRRKGDLDLALICTHPAQQDAFQAVANAGQHVLNRLHELGRLGPVADALPFRITHDGVRPDRPGPDGTAVYEVPLTRFRLSEDKIRELLMGRQLYDDPALAIRELYQNSLDACRYRDTRLEGLRRKGRRPAPWTGEIAFRQGLDGDREYIECEDNGVGMSREVLEHVFSQAGERFVYSQDYRAEHSLWQELDPPLRMVSNSQFGVGVFSYFMIADEILLYTRPVDQQGIPSSQGFAVRIASSGSLMQVTPSEEMLQGGTRIRLYLTGDEEPDKKISVLQTLRRLLWIAEYSVIAAEHGAAPEEWQPRHLRYQDESAESLKFDRDLWWVSGEGGLAADGLRTNEEIYGLIVNLRDEHRPQFTVDRKKLRTWHEDWVYGKVDDSLPALNAWPGLTLSWLWEVTDSSAEVAERIFKHLAKTRAEIPIGGGWGQSATVPLAEVGCVPQDKELFDPKSRNYYLYSRWFTIWRSGAWKGRASTQRNLRRIPQALSVEGFPLADPIDGALLARLHRQYGEDSPVLLEEILDATAHEKQTVAELLRRLRKFAITGLDLRHLHRCASVDLTFKKEDAPLAGALAAWSPPGLPPSPIIAGSLVKASAQLDQPLREVVRRAAAAAPTGWVGPRAELGQLGDHICTAAETRLLSVRLSTIPPWTSGPLQPAHIAHAAGELGRDISQILEMCDRFAPLGVSVAGRERYPESLSQVQVEALRHLEAVGSVLTPVQLIHIAGLVGTSYQEVRSELGALEECGLLRLAETNGVVDLVPDADTVGFISYALQIMDRWTGRQEFLHRPASLAVTAILSGRYMRRGATNQMKELTTFTTPDVAITEPDLILLASMIFGSIGEARDCFSRTYPEAQLPEIAQSAEDLQPWLLQEYLITPRWAVEPVSWTLGVGQIIAGALDFGSTVGEFLNTIAPYRVLGAPLPELPKEISEELSAWHPDLYDHELLVDPRETPAFGVDDVYLTEVDALRLVQIAGRLGMSLQETHQRLTRMAPLGLRLAYVVDAVPEGIVHWRDLLTLTVHLDGQKPELRGRVGSDHFTRAADATGESAADVLKRVRVYARLFSLDLPQEPFDD
ncbi:caspase family protein [Streptomyces sp. NPDC051576]|uniref:caspase family protein n=1 Tax=Streptomyces sp. NPDC051576 TaxID=3155803 RepID=UPI0034426EEA